MSLEQLQEHAKNLENLVATQKTELEDSATKLKEVNELNLDLQKRNLSLFKQVTQPTSEVPQGEEQTAPATCEEFANMNYKEILK